MEQKRFLIVEDDIESCKILNIVLADFDLTVVHTLASAKPHYQDRHFDIYMLDNWLPDGSGIDFCREIRLNHPDTPIIFTSAAAHNANISEATAAGATRYLVKPYDPFELQEIVKDLLDPSARSLTSVG
jgi:DNA-binding response OmpR family regulator